MQILFTNHDADSDNSPFAASVSVGILQLRRLRIKFV